MHLLEQPKKAVAAYDALGGGIATIHLVQHHDRKCIKFVFCPESFNYGVPLICAEIIPFLTLECELELIAQDATKKKACQISSIIQFTRAEVDERRHIKRIVKLPKRSQVNLLVQQFLEEERGTWAISVEFHGSCS